MRPRLHIDNASRTWPPRWTALLLAVPLAFGGAAPAVSRAQTGDTLYQATVIVTGTDMRSRPIGFAQAFLAVLVKVSGEPRLHDDPRALRLGAHASTLVTAYSYVDRMAGRPVHDEQGTRDRPYNLTVEFDPRKINQALAVLGEHPWRGPRPVVVPVLAVRGLNSSYVLSADRPAGADVQRTAFMDVARDYGLAARFPADADLAAWGVAGGRFPVPRAVSSADRVIVAGTLEFREALPGWVGAWRLRWHGRAYAWGIRGVNYDQAFRDLVRGVARIVSGHGAPE